MQASIEGLEVKGFETLEFLMPELDCGSLESVRLFEQYTDRLWRDCYNLKDQRNIDEEIILIILQVVSLQKERGPQSKQPKLS